MTISFGRCHTDFIVDNAATPIGLDPMVPSQKNWVGIALSIAIPLVVLITMILGVVYYVHSFNRNNQSETIKKTKHASITGSIDFDGYAPPGSSISIMQRLSGQGQFTPVITNIDPIDGEGWTWTTAQAGYAYDLQANLILNGVAIAQSKILTIAAPADSEVLRINSSVPAPAKQVALSGTIDLNGYVPTGAMISVSAQAAGSTQSTTFATGVYPADGAVWSWNNAQSGVSYQVQATLLLNGSVIGRSQMQTIAAPAQNEVLTINSTLTPPAPAQVTISGTFNIDGIVPNGSTISLAARPTGTTTFTTVATNISAVDSGTWAWTTAQAGTSYDVQAYIQSNGITSTSSQILTVTAPAANEVLTLNAPAQPPMPPNSSITNTCVGQNNGLWQVQFTYNNNNAITNAQQYQLTVGTSSGGNQLVNVTGNPSNPNNPSQSQTYTTGYLFTQGTTYFAQWSYATCANCNTFSPFSNSLQFYCNPAVPTNTPTPTLQPTNTPIPPTPTYTPVPTVLPTHTPTPTPILPTNAIKH